MKAHPLTTKRLAAKQAAEDRVEAYRVKCAKSDYAGGLFIAGLLAVLLCGFGGFVVHKECGTAWLTPIPGFTSFASYLVFLLGFSMLAMWLVVAAAKKYDPEDAHVARYSLTLTQYLDPDGSFLWREHTYNNEFIDGACQALAEHYGFQRVILSYEGDKNHSRAVVRLLALTAEVGPQGAPAEDVHILWFGYKPELIAALDRRLADIL